MAVLTRAESQQRTREALVQAATDTFLRDGFAATSLDAVAEAAGYTRGAVYSNFESKTAIGIAVIDELYAREERALGELLDPEAGFDEYFDALAAWADRTIGDPDWMRLEIEVAASTTPDDELHRAATAARFARHRAWVARFVRERFGDTLGVDIDTLATVLVGVGQGIGLQRAVDPAVGGATWVALLRDLVARAGRA